MMRQILNIVVIKLIRVPAFKYLSLKWIDVTIELQLNLGELVKNVIQ